MESFISDIYIQSIFQCCKPPWITGSGWGGLFWFRSHTFLSLPTFHNQGYNSHFRLELKHRMVFKATISLRVFCVFFYYAFCSRIIYQLNTTRVQKIQKYQVKVNYDSKLVSSNHYVYFPILYCTFPILIFVELIILRW